MPAYVIELNRPMFFRVTAESPQEAISKFIKTMGVNVGDSIAVHVLHEVQELQ